MAQMGMDVEAVESVGRQLKQSASTVDQIVGTLDKTVNGLSSLWDGPDAQRFMQSWPTFRKSLLAAQASVAGLGQSALNNASEQRDASGASGSTSHGGPVAPASPSGPSVSSQPQSGVAGAPAGSLPAGNVDAYHQFENSTSHYNSHVGYNVDANGKGLNNCTAWVDWRRQELGLPTAAGNGLEMAGNLQGTTSTPPTLGAVVSYAAPGLNGAPNPDGHVMLVEQVYDANPPSFRVSEDNFAGGFKDTRVWTQQPGGLWQADGRGPHFALTISPAAEPR